MADDKMITAPTPPTKQKTPSDLQTATTTTALLIDLAALLCILTWAAAGVLIGVILVGAFPFWLQVALMVCWLLWGWLGWLPWQMVDR